MPTPNKSRKQLISELTRTNTLFNKAERMGRLGYWEWDVLEDRLVTCSEQYAEIFETTQAEAIKHDYVDEVNRNPDSVELFNHDISKYIYDKDRERYIQETETAYRNKESWEIEFRFVTNSGRIVHLLEIGEPVLDKNGTLIRTFGIIQDITEFRQNEEKLAVQGVLLNNIKDGASLIRVSDGIILYTNPAFESMFGYEKNEMLGKPFAIIFAPTAELSQEQVAQHSRAELIKAKSMKGEFRKIKKDGTPILTSSSISTFNHPEHGDVFIAISRDITEQREKEKLLQRTQKLDALGKLTGGIAHDFNNLLGVILGYSELLQHQLIGNYLSEDYNKQIHKAAQRGAKLTKRLLTYTSKQQFEEKQININEVVCQQEDMLQKTLTVRVSLVLELTDGVWSLMLDDAQLEDAILNMCINAMHAIDDGNAESKITIATINKSINKSDAKALGLDAGDYVKLSITDTGCGISEEIKEQIFDPFFTTKGDKGTGLGLSQTIGFVERSGGTIKVISEPNLGSQFNLYFPRYIDYEDKEQTTTKKLELAKGGNESILVVDDEDALLDFAKSVLDKNGYQVYGAESGKQALQILDSNHIDLLLTDIIMPQMNGYELAVIVNERYPDVRIQLVSGYDDEKYIDLVDKKLHENIIRKPYGIQIMLKKVRTLLDNAVKD